MSNASEIQSSIRDNHKRGNVGDFLKNSIDEGSNLSIVSAYFTIYAYKKLQNKLDSIDSLKFLFGEPTFIKSVDPTNGTKKEFKIVDEHLVIPLENRLEQKATAKECADWIKNKVEIKSMIKPNFLHGKMYHIKKKNGVMKSIMGSSNFTVSGLGLSTSPNIELNVEITDDRDRKDLSKWFNALWNDKTGLVEDVKDKVLEYLDQLYIENDPQFIYYKTLYHLFEEYLNEQDSAELFDVATGFYDSEIWKMLFDFQKDAVKGAINKIEKYNGCIIADSVGLGKTFEALAIIKYYELKNNKVLVLVPKKLRQNWTLYQAHNNSVLNPLMNDKFGYTVLNHTDLSRDSGLSGDIDLSTVNWGNFDLVVIDESHNFRNDTKSKIDEDGKIIHKSRYEKLMQDIIKAGVNTKVLLLSATPVNNNLRDLRNQIYFITKKEDFSLFEKTGIPNIGETIKKAQTVFTNWSDIKKNPNPSVKTLFDRLGSDFFLLLDQLTLARSRKHIESFYKNELERIGKFSKRLPVISLSSDIAVGNVFPSYDKINEEIMNYKLSLFNPTAYVKEEKITDYEEKAGIKIKGFSQKERESHLIGMIKVGLLKRLESSIESFKISINRTLKKIEKLEKKIKAFQLNSETSSNIGEDFFDIGRGTEDDELNESLENTIGKKLKFNLADMNLDLWLEDLRKDKDPLIVLSNSANQITPEHDKKLQKLKALIQKKVEAPFNDNNKKVLVFTAFADTAKYLYENLKDFVQNELKLNIALITGGGNNKTTFGKSDYDYILTNFSPKSKNRDKLDLNHDEKIDILIATDCISEGQNLQDCDYLINYDIHWNPVRIIQRFGRIDRIGSLNKKIQLVNFWPTQDLDKYINLKNRVEARMSLVDVTATGEDNILEKDELDFLINGELKFRDKQLKRLKDEVLDLEDLEDNISLTDFSLEDYRTDLNHFIQVNKDKLENSPLGLYAIVPSPSGAYAEMGNYVNISQKAKELIQPGIIYCLRKKGDIKENSTVNPVFPYFLVYIRENKDVKYNFANVKQILEIYKKLCYSIDTPYEEICSIFNKETANGANMENQNELLMTAIHEINTIFKKRVSRNLINSRSGIIPKIKNDDFQFELITWLVIK